MLHSAIIHSFHCCIQYSFIASVTNRNIDYFLYFATIHRDAIKTMHLYMSPGTYVQVFF